MGGVSLALIFVFILMLNERGRRVKKMALVYEELDQKMGVMQMMMNSVREKEKNIIKIAQQQLECINNLSNEYYNDSAVFEEKKMGGEKNDIVDPRTLDANGKVKQSHLGREDYLIAMRERHSDGLDCVVSIDNSLQEALANAVDRSDSNLQEIGFSYQNLSELISILSADKSNSNKASHQYMVEELSHIQQDFEELLKYQKYNQCTYDKLSKNVLEKSSNCPVNVVTTTVDH